MVLHFLILKYIKRQVCKNRIKKHAVNFDYSISCTMHLKKQSLSLHSVITFFVVCMLCNGKGALR